MKQRNMTTLVLAALLVGLGTLSFAQESALQPEVHAERGIQYVSGGVGQGELARLRQMARDYDLKLVFAWQRGNYLADIPVVIRDQKGNTVLDAVAQGPWMLVELPAGTYTVTATAYEQPKQQVVYVNQSGQSELLFTWHAPPWEHPLSTHEAEAR
jgi:hypothetical protein